MKNFFLAVLLFSNLSSLLSAESYEIAPNYTLVFDGKTIYQGGGLDLRFPSDHWFDWGIRAQLLVANQGWSTGPRFFDLSLAPRFKHAFELGNVSLELYCLLLIGSTYGAQKTVTNNGVAYIASNPNDLIPFYGFNTGIIPGINLRFEEHWVLFSEFGFSYHLLSPSKLSIHNSFGSGSSTISPDVINLVAGVFNAGLAYRF